MPRLPCIVCSTLFYAKPSHISKGWGKFCSKECQYESQKTGKFVACFRCGTSTYRNKNSLSRSDSGNFFCTKSCQTIWRNQQYRQEKHANWVDGKSSYRAVLLRENRPLICTKCSTNDKRVLAVHHLDRNRANNTPENLVWLCHNCHFLVHNFKEESEGYLLA
jgi:hypothetical protein